MVEIKDWKGNIVKEGDEVCFIKTIDRDYIQSAGFYLNGTFHETKSHPEPDVECWVVGEYFKVRLCNGELATSKTITDNDLTMTATNYLSTALAFMDINCCQLGIKGISDKND